MRRTRVVVANDPRSYREAIAGVFRSLRPDVEVLVIEPVALDARVEDLSPDLVICSRLTPAVRRGARKWVELYPEGEGVAVIGCGERSRARRDIELEDLLFLVDAAAESS